MREEPQQSFLTKMRSGSSRVSAERLASSA
nr:MAG TPA: hypothetical protein [Caudoviricetes sp.]